MEPVLPVIPGQKLPETYFAKDQSEYNTLPSFRDDTGVVVTRWHCTWRERLRVLLTDDVYLQQATFNHPLQPVRLDTEPPVIETVPAMASPLAQGESL